MPAIELRGDRVVANNSILARADGSFFDFNGSINYRNYRSLLKVHPELGIANGKYVPPKGDRLSTHNSRAVTKVAQQMKAEFNPKLLDNYLPFYDYGRIQSNVGTAYTNGLAVFMWRPSLSGSARGSHYAIAQYRGNPLAKWMSIKGSDSKTVESMIFNDSPVYSTFGMGDFLLLKSTGLNYMCFAGDGGAKNSPYVEFMKKQVGSREIRLIADNDTSGLKTADYLRKYGFKVKVFDWSLLKKAEKKMDLRDLAWQLKDLGGDIDTLKNLVTRGNLYG